MRPSYEFKPERTCAGPIAIPAGSLIEDRNFKIKMAELHIWDGKAIDVKEYYDIFKDPGRIMKMDKKFGKPTIRLHWASNWKHGKNTGESGPRKTGPASGVDPAEADPERGAFDDVGKIVRYLPDPKERGKRKMIVGVVAQERRPTPRGTFDPVRVLDDVDVFFRPVINNGLTQNLGPPLLAHDDELFAPEVPFVLSPPLVDDAIFPHMRPFVRQDRVMLPLLYVDADLLRLPDIRMPGFLLPGLHVDVDVIHPTPLILDRGMLRQEVLHNDFDIVLSNARIVAADTQFPPLLVDTDVIHAPLVRVGLGPPLMLMDDAFFVFSSEVTHFAELYIDDGVPVHEPTTFDGPSLRVEITNDGLSVFHYGISPSGGIIPGFDGGARSTQLMTSGRYYWEVKVGPSHGVIDCCRRDDRGRHLLRPCQLRGQLHGVLPELQQRPGRERLHPLRELGRGGGV